MVERLWRTVKYEDIYLRDYQDAAAARAGLERYLVFYNTERPHQGLDYRTPAEVIKRTLCNSRRAKGSDLCNT